MKRPAILVGSAVLALSLLGVSSAATLPLAGNLDPSFGSGGVVTHDLGSGEGPAITGIAVQPDGKIVVAGGASPGDHGFLLARYLPDGSLDPRFGNGGYVETRFPSWAFARRVALQPDGKIVVAGDSLQGDGDEFTLARYNPDGSLDRSFGTDGITNTPIPEPGPSWSAADALAIVPSGDILAGGPAGWDNGDVFGPPSSFALARYTAAGTLDPSFGDGGIVQTTFGGRDSLAGMAVQPDGKIVASGTSFGPDHGDEWQSMALARYEPNGSLDPTFGSGGEVTTAHKLAYGGGPLTLQQGKIVVAGFTRLKNSVNDVPVLARYEANGRLDPALGKGGFAELRSITGNDATQGYPTAIVTQSNGELLIAAANRVARLTLSGRLDKSFGREGIVSLTGGVWAGALALQADGKVLAGGSSGNTLQSSGDTWIIARLLRGNNCVVPRLRGKLVPTATAMLTKAYCSRGRIAKRYSSEVARGRVISTEVPRGTRLPGGAKVDLMVSKGKRP